VRPGGARLALAALLVHAVRAGSQTAPPREPSPEVVTEDAARGIEGAVFLERISVSNGRTLELRCRLRVLSKAGLSAGTVSGLPADVRDLKGRTVSPDGTVTELAPSDLRTTTRLTGGGLSIRESAFTFPKVEAGATLEWSCTLPGPFGTGSRFHNDFLLQHRWFAQRQELRVPASLAWNITLDSMNGVAPRHEVVGNERVFVVLNAAPIGDEPIAPPAAERAAKIVFSWPLPGVPSDPAGYWREATRKGIAEVFTAQLVRPGLLEETLGRLPGSRTTDPLARLAAIHGVVQKLRNRDVELADSPAPRGGWPENRDTWAAMRNGSGTSFELTMLLGSLLRADGWSWRVVLVADREWRIFHPELPSMHQFGGVIVEAQVPGATEPVRMSVDHPALPFRGLPWNYSGGSAWAVDVAKGTGEEVTIPFPPAAENRAYRVERWELEDSGRARVIADEYRSGGRAFERRAEILAAGSDPWKAARRKLASDRGESVDAITLAHLDEADTDLALHEERDVPELAAPLPGGRLELAPFRSRAQENPFVAAKRKLPISFPWPYVDEDEIALVPPPGWSVRELPAKLERKTSAGSYSVAAERGADGGLTVRRRLELRRAIGGGPEHYASFRNLFEAASSADRGWALVLERRAEASAEK
jgi:hypothetical protein